MPRPAVQGQEHKRGPVQSSLAKPPVVTSSSSTVSSSAKKPKKKSVQRKEPLDIHQYGFTGYASGAGGGGFVESAGGGGGLFGAEITVPHIGQGPD